MADQLTLFQPGGHIIPTQYYVPFRIFRPCDGPVCLDEIEIIHKKVTLIQVSVKFVLSKVVIRSLYWGIWTWMFSFFGEKVKENFVGMISHFEQTSCITRYAAVQSL